MQKPGVKTDHAKQCHCLCSHILDLGLKAGLVEELEELPLGSQGWEWARSGKAAALGNIFVCQVWARPYGPGCSTWWHTGELEHVRCGPHSAALGRKNG